MYTSYWNLRASPFLNSDDESFLYPSDQLREGVARLYYLIDQERVAGMVTGPYGVGKTFLLSCLVRRTQKAKIPLVRFDAIPQGGLPMARFLLGAIGVDDKPATFADAMMSFQRRCMDGGRGLARHVLLIDEAHFLAEGDGLNLVHFLSNLRIRLSNGDRPLFTIVLSGPPALARLVDEYESLRRRIQLVWTLDPLSRQQTFEYVQQHMRAAGGDIWAFSGEALDAVHSYSGGIPRNINNICDTALMLGFAAGASTIGPEIVREAADDSGLSRVRGVFGDPPPLRPAPPPEPPPAPPAPYPAPPAPQPAPYPAPPSAPPAPYPEPPSPPPTPYPAPPAPYPAAPPAYPEPPPAQPAPYPAAPPAPPAPYPVAPYPAPAAPPPQPAPPPAQPAPYPAAPPPHPAPYPAVPYPAPQQPIQ